MAAASCIAMILTNPKVLTVVSVCIYVWVLNIIPLTFPNGKSVTVVDVGYNKVRSQPFKKNPLKALEAFLFFKEHIPKPHQFNLCQFIYLYSL